MISGKAVGKRNRLMKNIIFRVAGIAYLAGMLGGICPLHADIVTIGTYQRLYESPYINDHCVIYDRANGMWHMFGIYGNQRRFIHLTSDSLTASPWIRAKDDYVYSPDREIWAPHMIRSGGKYWMYFTAIGEPRQIALSTSKDLYDWTHWTKNPILAHSNEDGSNAKCKDPMVLRHGDKWTMYYSTVKKRENDQDYWAVGCRTSTNLVDWVDPRIVFDEDKPNDPGVESPFVVKRGKHYYLFLSARPWHCPNNNGGVDVFRSETPFSWDPRSDQVARFSKEETGSHAPEIVRDLDGQWYLTRVGHDANGFWIAPLIWNDGWSEAPPN